MKVNPAIFKTYDIRGIWGQDINIEIAETIGKAYATFLQPKKVMCGRDVRNSGPEFQAAVIRGMREMGVDVTDIGVVTSDALYFAVANYGFDGGAMVTASHNPSEWNGIKFTRDQAKPIIGDENKRIGQLVASEEFSIVRDMPGNLVQLDVTNDYVKQVLSFHQTGGRRLKVVIDPGNGTAARFLDPIMDGMSHDWVGMNLEPDGNFPGRGPNPLGPGAVEKLGQAVVEQKANLGVAFDADSDRMFFVDELGQRVFGDALTALLAKEFLLKEPGAPIVYNLICSHMVPEEITKSGGQPIRSAVGHAHMKPAMRQHNAPFGGEISGHFFFRDHYFVDSGLVAMVVGLDFLAKQEKPISHLVKEIDVYAHDAEINTKVENVQSVLAAIKNKYSDGKLDETDGVTIEYPTWWFNVRPSNTEPLLRLTVEARTQDEMKTKREELLTIIRTT